jgi:hypothetical protein
MKIVKGKQYYGVRPTPETLKPLPPAPVEPPGDGLAVLILCAGFLHEWEGGSPRQLREIGGETVLDRQIRQIRANGHEPIIVTWREDIIAATPDVVHYDPLYFRTIAETWLYTRELWRAQTVILLGDVISGDLTMREMLAYRGEMKMIGNSAEIYAFTFSSKEHDKAARVLYETDRDTLKGSPWEIYRRWCGTAYNNRGFREAAVFQWVWDRVCDIDSPNEWQGALRIFNEAWG